MTTLFPPQFVDVLVPVALDQAYSYRVPPGLDLKPGDIVNVPLGARSATGVVWADNVEIRPGLHNRMKEVEEKLDLPPMKPELRKFVDWLSEYTLSPRGMVLRMCLRRRRRAGFDRARAQSPHQVWRGHRVLQRDRRSGRHRREHSAQSRG